jgi:hypothetical protein
VTHPQARQYLAEVTRRVTQEWGYKYLKMDGLFTGTGARLVYVNDDYTDDAFGETTPHDPKKTHVEVYREGLKIVRHAAGREGLKPVRQAAAGEVFFLGCCIPQNMRSYGGAFGLVDAMRIGPDNNPKSWDGILRGPKYGSRHYFEHGRIWYADPDPVYVRESLPMEQARALASWVSLSGQLYVVSDALTKLPPERLEVLKRTMATHGAVARPVDLFDADIPRLWLVTDTRHGDRRDVIGLFNWEEKEAVIESRLDRIGMGDTGPYVAFDYWDKKLLPPLEGTLRATVPGRSCRVLAVRRAADHPQLISTSRHVTQGMVDVLEEKWDAGESTLRGRSKLIANDPYELRVALPAGGKGWTLADADASADDRAAGVKLSHKQEDGLVRVPIAAPAAREVIWTLKFNVAP